MADSNSGPGWSDAQWEMVQAAVTETFGKASVAGAFLPCYGPLPDSAEYVRAEVLSYLKRPADSSARLRITDDDTLKLFTVTVQVELSREQVAEKGLSSALFAFRRAANILAQNEDLLIFKGQAPPKAAAAAYVLAGPVGPAGPKDAVVISGPRKADGLVDAAQAAPAARALVAVGKRAKGPAKAAGKKSDRGERIVTSVVDAMSRLEGDFHPGPFACVLDSHLYAEAHKPVAGSMVLPADRITPLLRGPLLRCGQVPDDTGFVASLSGTDIDIVVATAPTVQFLQVTPEAKFLFRVFEKFRLRIKDATAVRKFVIPQ